MHKSPSLGSGYHKCTLFIIIYVTTVVTWLSCTQEERRALERYSEQVEPEDRLQRETSEPHHNDVEYDEVRVFTVAHVLVA